VQAACRAYNTQHRVQHTTPPLPPPHTNTGSGTIDVAELRVALEAMGQHPTEEELFVLVNEADEDQSGEIELYAGGSIVCGAPASCVRAHASLTHVHITHNTHTHRTSHNPTTSQEFVRVIARHRAASAARDDEADTVGAFVALGGNVRP
jgi:hypothetical protein